MFTRTEYRVFGIEVIGYHEDVKPYAQENLDMNNKGFWRRKLQRCSQQTQDELTNGRELQSIVGHVFMAIKGLTGSVRQGSPLNSRSHAVTLGQWPCPQTAGSVNGGDIVSIAILTNDVRGSAIRSDRKGSACSLN